MVRIGLHGELAQKIGKDELFYSVKTGAEALRAISANYSWFRHWIIEKEKSGLFFRIVVDDKIQEEESLLRNKSEIENIEIVPAIVGAGTEIFVALLISAVISGITFLLTPKPEIPSIDTSQTVNAGAESFTFGGRVNRLRQGVPVPLAYGRLKIGSNVISAYLENKNIDELGGSNLNKLLNKYKTGTTIVFADAAENYAEGVRFEGPSFSKKDRVRIHFSSARVTNSYQISDTQIRVDWYASKRFQLFGGRIKGKVDALGYSIFNIATEETA